MKHINYPFITEFIEDIVEDMDFIELRKYAKENKVPIMNIETKELLKTLIEIKNPKSILEIGSAIGYSSLVFNKYSNAKITTIEIDEKMADIANYNFKKYHADVNLINKDAMKALNDLDQGFDFVFIDANKSHYRDYFDKSSTLLNSGGIIIADNVLFRGRVCNDDLVFKRKNTIIKRLRNYLAYVTDLDGFTTSIVPIGDGLTISIKER